MQRQYRNRVLEARRTRRTEPALPGATLPTAPLVAPTTDSIEAVPPARKKGTPDGWPIVWRLLLLAFFLEILLVALYPLFAATVKSSDPAQQALLGLFHWLPRLYWTQAFPDLAHWLTHFSTFNPQGGGSANLLLLFLSSILLLSLLASLVGRRAVKNQLTREGMRRILWAILSLTALFGLTLVIAPSVLSQDMLLYGFYGRMVTLYHLNPYVVSPFTAPHDLLQSALPANTPATASSGPAWLDLTVVVTLLARNSVANIVVIFRLVGLVAHLINTILVWAILAKLRPALRFSSMLLYAWNPLVLLVSIAGMHQDVVVVTLLLVATYFYQRKAPIRGWVFLLLAALINLFVLLLLPLYLKLFQREERRLSKGERLLSWLAIVSLSAVILVAVYVPFWHGLGFNGLALNLRHVFLQDVAHNSLDSAMLSLPVTLPHAVTWMLAPHHWLIFTVVVVGIFLLFGLWLVDTLQMVLLFSSWILLALLVLLPDYWPWYTLLALALAICSAGPRTRLLALLLTAGGILGCYWSLWQPVWAGQGLVTIGLPLLLWGWTLFFTSTWQMTHSNEEQPVVKPVQGRLRSRWPSKASWASRSPRSNRRR